MSDLESKFLAASRARTDANSRRVNEAAEERLKNSSEEESVSRFLKDFNADYFIVLEKLDGIDSGKIAVTARDRGAVLDVLGEAHKVGLNLRERTASASLFLNPYDVRSCENKVDVILKKIIETKKAVIPREKFVFKSRRKEGSFYNQEKENVEKNDNAGEGGQGEGGDGKNEKEEKYSLEFSMLSDTTHTTHVKCLPYNLGDIRLKDIKNSTFALLDVYGAVRLANLENCTVYLGMIKGPLYVENVKDCRIFATARQLRIHDTIGVDFYVHTCSGPIIEHCDKCRFGPRVHEYEGLAAMQKESGLLEINKGKNMYFDVQDFRWLKKMQSPHWSLLDVESGKGGAVSKSECQGVIVRTKEAEIEEAEERRRQREEEDSEKAGGAGGAGEESEEESEDEL